MKLPIQILLGLGIVLFIGGIVGGFGGTIFGMLRSFSELGSPGIADPQKLSASISTTLVSTAVGIIAAILGFFIVVASIIAHIITKTNKKT